MKNTPETSSPHEDTGTGQKLLFADAVIASLEANRTLPAKFKRMLKRGPLAGRVKGRSVAVKMHLGGGIGYTTIHPVFVRILIEYLKDAGAQSIKVIDGDASTGLARGYTSEVLGCPVVSCFGESGKYYYPEAIGFGGLDEALLSGEAVDCDVFIDLSHIKGHGDCGFGGALKNIAMGLVPRATRQKLHRLEGGVSFDRDKCIFCLKCLEACPNNAIQPDRESREIGIFFHNCTYCQHCVMVCPESALTMENRQFKEFALGMAKVTAAFLSTFDPADLYFINFLTNITIYCDCWGFSSPSLVPDIGIVAGSDIAAVETASLDMIKTDKLLPEGLPADFHELGEGKHLFENIHGKDPYLMIEYLSELYACDKRYETEEIR